MEQRVAPKKVSSNCDMFPQSNFNHVGVWQNDRPIASLLTFMDKIKAQCLLWVAEITSFVSAQSKIRSQFRRDPPDESNADCGFREIKGHGQCL
jgi:hypothetical protein